MQKLLNIWLLRNITPIGRIKVVKSLALSKLTHILLSLPSPSPECMEKLDKMFINFIWGGKRHAVNKNIVYAPTDKGGLDMIRVKDFDQGLKLTWLRKYIKSKEPWHEIATKLHIDRLFFVGPKEIILIMSRCHNNFWKDVCKAALRVHSCINISTPLEIIKAPLWGNTFINIPTQYKWFKYGVVEVGDLFKHGAMYTREELNDRVQSVVPYITYRGIVQAIPKVWKTTIEENFQTSHNMTLSTFQQLILADAKGCRTIRNFIRIKEVETPWTNAWNNTLDEVIERPDWTPVYKTLWKLRLSPNLQYFQYQIINRSLMTNKKLAQFKIVESNLCSFCLDSIETIEHMLYRCPLVKALWVKIQEWCNKNNYNKIKLEEKFILLGIKNQDYLLHTIINLTKQTIYKNKFKNKVPNLNHILYTWRACLDIEGYIAMCNNRGKTFLGKWSPLYKPLKDL